MATNPYFSQKVVSEQRLYEDIIIESLQIYGNDVYYLPRDIVNEDRIFGDDIPSSFNSSYIVEMYIENIDGFDGENDLFTKFGVEIRDQVTFVVSRRRWDQTVNKYDNDINSSRPRIGDLIYIPMTRAMFQIMHVEHEQPFYQLSNLPTFKLRCEKFEYSGEDLDTGITEIDKIEQTGYELVFNLADSDGVFEIGETVTQTTTTGVVMTGEVTYFNDSDDVLKITHIGNDSDEYHTFNVGAILAPDTGVIRTIVSIEDEYNHSYAQNEDFKDEGLNILDWTEDNPFGEPLES